jgi:hypothetical protein
VEPQWATHVWNSSPLPASGASPPSPAPAPRRVKHPTRTDIKVNAVSRSLSMTRRPSHLTGNSIQSYRTIIKAVPAPQFLHPGFPFRPPPFPQLSTLHSRSGPDLFGATSPHNNTARPPRRDVKESSISCVAFVQVEHTRLENSSNGAPSGVPVRREVSQLCHR